MLILGHISSRKHKTCQLYLSYLQWYYVIDTVWQQHIFHDISEAKIIANIVSGPLQERMILIKNYHLLICVTSDTNRWMADGRVKITDDSNHVPWLFLSWWWGDVLFASPEKSRGVL